MTAVTCPRSTDAKGRWVPRPSGLSRTSALILLALALVVTACASVEERTRPQVSGGDDDADAGARSTAAGWYGLEAETTNGWCLPEGRSPSPASRWRSIYDTLACPTATASSCRS